MGEERERRRGPAGILPLFSPALFDFWQIILPRNRLVIHVRERERDDAS
ncbi:MAG: hypothetical protein LN413_07780 [Candidatus Thermoplasmatota archaeon]|nr:hypothetical protein [Candidatus Thermoplasmatota archaeon]